MTYQISGQQIDIGRSLQGHISKNLDGIMEKFDVHSTDVQVFFSRDAHKFICETVVHLSTGQSLQARAQSTNIYAAGDSAADKIEKQLRRQKRKMKSRHRAPQDYIELNGNSAYRHAEADESDVDTGLDVRPVIIAETCAGLPCVSVRQAADRLDAKEAGALVFCNERNNAVNVVYRRKDGNIGWIEPG